MPVLVRCPECATAVRVDRDRAGARRRCAECGLVFRPGAGRGERPAPAPRSNGPLLAALVAAAFLLLAGCGVGGFLVFRAATEPAGPNAPGPDVADAGPNRAPVGPEVPRPAPPELKEPAPAGPQPYVLGPYQPKPPEPEEPEPVEPKPVAPVVPKRVEPEPVRPKPAEPGAFVPAPAPKAVEPVAPKRPPGEKGEVVDLGGALRAVHTGGRYLVFHLETPHRLVVYDVPARKEVSTIDLADRNVQVAVGREKAFVGRWQDGRITRYDLRTGKAEATGGPDPPERLTHLAVAADGDGPLVSGANRTDNQFQARLYDPETLAPLTAPIEGGGTKDDNAAFPFAQRVGAGRIAVSADGRGIALGGRYYIRTATGYKAVPVNPSSGLRPTPDGSALVGNSLWTADGRVVRFADREARWLFPAAGGPFFLGLEYGAGHEPRLMLHADQDPKPLGALPTGPTFAAWVQKEPTLAAVTAHQCVAFLPEPALLVVAPAKGTEALLVPVDLPALLAKGGRELAFTSVPPAAVPRDRKYAYQATAITRTGARPTFKLESGPPGMTVSAAGALAWNPAADFDKPTADVRLAARTADGASVVQEFRLFLPPK